MIEPEVHGSLTRRDGKPCPPVPYVGRRLDERHLDTVIALHRLVVATTPPHLVAAETDAFFADHVARIGRLFGLFVEDGLIAYGVLGLPGPGDPCFADDLGLAAADRARAANIDGISVRPEWRGNRLQRVLIAWRLRDAVAAGRSLALTTVAPGNVASLRNALAEGLLIRGLRRKYGGWRYVMARDLARPPSPVPAGGRWLAASDLAGQEPLLAEGLIGWKVDVASEGPRLWFAPAATGDWTGAAAAI